MHAPTKARGLSCRDSLAYMHTLLACCTIGPSTRPRCGNAACRLQRDHFLDRLRHCRRSMQLSIKASILWALWTDMLHPIPTEGAICTTLVHRFRNTDIVPRMPCRKAGRSFRKDGPWPMHSQFLLQMRSRF